MDCDHEHGICLLPFVRDMTLAEFLRRLVHVFGPAILEATR